MWPFRRKATEERAITFQSLWGSGADLDNPIHGSSINTALTLVPVFAAVKLISDAISCLPLEAYRKTGEKKTDIPTPLLLSDPTMFGGPQEWVQRCLASLLLKGNAYGLITEFDARGFPRRVEWLHPDDVTIEDDRAVKRPVWFWLGRRLDPWLGRDSMGELVHIPWFVLPGHVKGLSPIAQFAMTVEGGIYAQQFGKNFFKNGAIPSAVLETDQQVDQPAAAVIKDRFRMAAKGREPVVLGAGTKYRAITVSPEESQFLETIRANATMIAAIYGIYPAELIGGDTKDSMTYANVEQRGMDLAMNTLTPPTTKLEQHFSGLLPRPQYAVIDLDSRFRADRKARYETHQIALTNKIKTVDEVRDEEGLAPLTDSQKKELGVGEPPAADPNADPTVDPNAKPGGQVVRLPRAANE